MGLYYNPPLPLVGGAQPLSPKKITPPLSSYGVAVAESVAAADAQAGIATLVAAQAESTTATDATATLAVLVAADAETVSITDATDSTSVSAAPPLFKSSFNERIYDSWGSASIIFLTGPFVPLATNTYSVTAAETVSTADAQATVATLVAADAESVTATAAQASLATLVAADSETVSAADASASGAVLVAAIAESSSATDASASLGVLVAADAETSAATDATGSLATLPAAIAESVSAVDATDTSTNNVYSVSQAESIAAADASASLAILAAANAEAISTGDSTGSLAILVAAQNETASISDAPASLAVLVAAIAESEIVVAATDAPAPPTSGSFDYIFRFNSQTEARNDPIVGPYFNPTNAGMLLDLWVYDLAVTGSTLNGWWCLIQQTADVPLFDASPNLELVFAYPGPILLTNNLPSYIGEKFSIIAGQFALAYINNWSQRNR